MPLQSECRDWLPVALSLHQKCPVLTKRSHCICCLQAETKEIVRERIDLEEAQARAAQAAPRHDEGDINTDDEEDEQGQMRDFDAWRLRELARIAK